MNAKKDSFEESIREAQEEERSDEPLEIYKYKWVYEEELIEEIKSKIKDEVTSENNEEWHTTSLELWFVPDGPYHKSQEAIVNVKELLLRTLEADGAIQKLEVSVTDEVNDIYPIPIERVLARFTYRPLDLDGAIDKALSSVREAKKRALSGPSVKYFIDYDSSSRVILLNGKYLLAKPDFLRTNDRFFDFVYGHPYATLTRQSIERYVGKRVGRFHNILNALSFKGEIRNLFFPSVGKNALRFRNYIDESDLTSIKNVNFPKLEDEIKALAKSKSTE